MRAQKVADRAEVDPGIDLGGVDVPAADFDELLRFASRFEDDRRGTNPEEILGAAHAACFTMAFSFACEKAGFATRHVDTRAAVRLVKQGEGFAIDRIALTMEATVPEIDEAKFQEIANGAKQNCPLSKALASVPEITLEAVLKRS